MELLIQVEGATEEDRERGVAAAQRVFEAGRVTAQDCAWAAFDRDRCHDQGGNGGLDPSQEHLRRASLWHEAERVGIEACCSRMAHRPETRYLELRFGSTNFSDLTDDRPKPDRLPF
jgi:hypothetical protein